MIGERNCLVTIQSPGADLDSAGGPDPWKTPTTFATEWAKIRPLSGRERMAAQQIVSDTSLAIEIRYRDDITPQMRIVCGAHTYSIHAALPDYTRKRETVLVCSGAR